MLFVCLKGGHMAKRRTKPVSFDAMVKFFMRNYEIPTKRDVEMLAERMDRLEDLIRKTSGVRGRSAKQRRSGGRTAKKTDATATGKVMEVVKRFRAGVGFKDIQMRTGFEDKKLRNIIFRLNKLGKIKRKSRGIYIAA